MLGYDHAHWGNLVENMNCFNLRIMNNASTFILEPVPKIQNSWFQGSVKTDSKDYDYIGITYQSEKTLMDDGTQRDNNFWFPGIIEMTSGKNLYISHIADCTHDLDQTKNEHHLVYMQDANPLYQYFHKLIQLSVVIR